MLHLLEVRRLLEPAATAMAARTMTDSEIAALGELAAVTGPPASRKGCGGPSAPRTAADCDA